jgi:hypothetical protein
MEGADLTEMSVFVVLSEAWRIHYYSPSPEMGAISGGALSPLAVLFDFDSWEAKISLPPPLDLALTPTFARFRVAILSIPAESRMRAGAPPTCPRDAHVCSLGPPSALAIFLA